VQPSLLTSCCNCDKLIITSYFCQTHFESISNSIRFGRISLAGESRAHFRLATNVHSFIFAGDRLRGKILFTEKLRLLASVKKSTRDRHEKN